jgi:dolichyl-phosphate beta-glucosyltransferase
MKLTLVIPAYNERERLPSYLHSIRAWLDSMPSEVVVVDDGSTDGMSTLLEEIFAGWSELKIVKHARNSGRGQAIRTGSEQASGDIVLFADADGATPICEEAMLRAAIAGGADIAIGSRVGRHERVCRIRALHRWIISRVFAKLVKLLFSLPLRDTQCGFKMWRREVGEAVLAHCREKRWLLDVEFLAVAHQLGYRIAEVPVNWSEVPGSKIRLLRDSWGMFRGLWSIRKSLRRMRAPEAGPLVRCEYAGRPDPVAVEQVP